MVGNSLQAILLINTTSSEGGTGLTPLNQARPRNPFAGDDAE
ncbi:anacyclamide/piricyclamide family prenylated cyclic peptide [Planktothrix agardhii]